MPQRNRKPMSSKQLLEKIGLADGQLDPELTMVEEDDFWQGDLGQLLRERYHQLKEVHYDLRPGMVVTWKPGLKNRKWPRDGAPAVIVEQLDVAVYDTDESGSTYFREPLDMIVGFFLDSGEHRGDFLVFHANSQRYQPWPGQED